MRKNKIQKPSWFMTTDRCPYSGLAITRPETIDCSDSENDFHADIAMLGEHMLLVKSYGYVSASAESRLLAFLADFVSRQFNPEVRIVYIEDYADLTGGDADSRRQYLAFFKQREFIIAGIIYNVPSIYKISFNLFKKMNIHSSRGHAVNSYAEAVTLGLKLLDQNKADHGQIVPSSVAGADRLYNKSGSFYSIPVSQVTGWIRRVFAWLNGINPFFTQKARHQFKKQISEELIRYIASIDWQTPGMPPPEKTLIQELSTKKIFDAISFVKSEIDTMMEERAESEAVLRESETRYRLLVTHAKAGFLEFDYVNSQIISVNDEFVRMTGYSESELLGRDPMELMTEESQNMLKQRRSQVITEQSVPQDVIYQIITKDNERRWLLLNSNVTYHNNYPEKASVVVTDITQFKETEHRLLEYQEKLKRLSVRLSMVEEDQRRSMASRLHETIGQELFVMQLQIAAFEKSIDNPALFPGVKQINDQLLKIIKETKSLTFDLSPPVLYDLGFSEAMTTLAQIVKQKHNIDMKTAFEGDMDVIDNEIKVILYRNIKELIHNTIKHAKAQNISIRFKNCRSQLYVEFRDDGIGFDAAGDIGAMSTHEGFGLFDIREKLNHLGGRLLINSTPGQGASVSMQVPLNVCVN